MRGRERKWNNHHKLAMVSFQGVFQPTRQATADVAIDGSERQLLHYACAFSSMRDMRTHEIPPPFDPFDKAQGGRAQDVLRNGKLGSALPRKLRGAHQGGRVYVK